MTSEIICIDDVFSDKVMKIYKKYGVSIPKLNSVYSPRKIIRHTNGEIGVLLEGLVNPEIPLDEMGIQWFKMEPTWNLRKRFRTLDDKEITEEMVKEWKLEEKGLLELIKLKEDGKDL